MIRSKVLDSKVYDQIKKRLAEFSKDQPSMEKVGQVLVRNIVADSIKGRGYDGNPLPDLAPATIKRRERLATVNGTSRFFRASLANITFLGSSLKSLYFTVANGVISLRARGKHAPIKGIRVDTLKGSDAAHADIHNGLRDLGYKHLGASELSVKSISKLFREYIRRVFKSS
jgi:hypothetical protein